MFRFVDIKPTISQIQISQMLNLGINLIPGAPRRSGQSLNFNYKVNYLLIFKIKTTKQLFMATISQNILTSSQSFLKIYKNIR